MAAVAKNPAFAKKVGIKQSVGEDFLQADKGRKFGSGGKAALQGINKPKTNHGAGALFKEGGMAESKKEMREEMKADKAQDVALITKAFKQHDAQEHKGGKGTTIKLAKGGSASARADGCAVKGKTKGTMIAMCGGGMTKGKK